jgi:hypothetical protein
VRLVAGTIVLLAACAAAPAEAAADGRGDWWPGSSSVLEKEEIPPAFRGTWGLDEGACRDRDRPDRMTIYRQGIDQYESGARLRQITTVADRTVRVRFDVEGESVLDEAEWVLRVSPDRRELFVISTPDGPEQHWVKCGRAPR